MKKQKLTLKEKKLTKKIASLEVDVDDLKFDVREAKNAYGIEHDKKLKAEGKVEGLERSLKNIVRQLEWLKSTLRLVVVPEGNMDELHRIV